MGSNVKYTPLRWGKQFSTEETHVEDGSTSQLPDEKHCKVAVSRGTWRRFFPWIFHSVIIVFYLIILPHISWLWLRPQESCVDKFYSYSPINEAISEDYVDQWFQGSLWYDSPYKGPPTPKTNKAWEDLMEYGAISVTAEDIQRVGHNLTAVQYPPEVGGGYLAVAMGTHHIHCLHYIWQDHYTSYFPETKANKEGASEMYERHYEHCIDYLRQGIMCNFDPGIIPYYWVNQHNQPTPDGNTFHKCVDWARVQDWLKNRAVTKPEGFEWHQPADAVPLPHNP